MRKRLSVLVFTCGILTDTMRIAQCHHPKLLQTTGSISPGHPLFGYGIRE